MGRALTAGNPLSTWYMLKSLLTQELDDNDILKGKNRLARNSCQFEVIRRIRKDFSTFCNLNILEN